MMTGKAGMGKALIGAGKGFAGKGAVGKGAVGVKGAIGAKAGGGGKAVGASPGKGAVGTAPGAKAAPAGTKRPFGMFGTLGKVAGPSGGGNWFKDGRYYVMVNKVTAAESKQNRGEYVAAEMTVLEVVNGWDTSNTVGERVSAVFMASTPNQMGIINLKGFLGACTGMDPNATSPEQNGYASDEAWAEAGENACAGDGTVLAGTILDVTATTIKTRAQKDFTKVAFTACDEETTAQIVANTAAGRGGGEYAAAE